MNLTRRPLLEPAVVDRRRFYSYRDLAGLWRRKEQTIRLWVMQLRREGRGPKPEQICVWQPNAAIRVMTFRGDYVDVIQNVKLIRQK